MRRRGWPRSRSCTSTVSTARWMCCWTWRSGSGSTSAGCRCWTSSSSSWRAMDRLAGRVMLDRRADWLVLATRLVLLRSRLMFPASPQQAVQCGAGRGAGGASAVGAAADAGGGGLAGGAAAAGTGGVQPAVNQAAGPYRDHYGADGDVPSGAARAEQAAGVGAGLPAGSDPAVAGGAGADADPDAAGGGSAGRGACVLPAGGGAGGRSAAADARGGGRDVRRVS